MNKGMLFVVSGPSGVGKGTICNLLMKRRPNLKVSISCATRDPRPGEVDGREYFFISNERFDEMIEKGELLEYACVHKNRYGTPRFYVEQMLSEGYDVILEIDVQGGRQVMAAVDEMTGIFVLPPSYQVLVERLMGRNTETKEQIELRLKNSIDEIRAAEAYNFLLVNDDLELAVEQLDAIISAQHHTFMAKKEHLHQLYKQFEEEN